LGINPQVKILIQGSTKARTRLYQIAINKYFNEVEHKFTIWGFIEDDIELFMNGKNYDGFVVEIKKIRV
jgi:hypothetical protein